MDAAAALAFKHDKKNQEFASSHQNARWQNGDFTTKNSKSSSNIRNKRQILFYHEQLSSFTRHTNKPYHPLTD